MIPDEIINQILDKVDIAEVISGYIPLKRAGRNFKANCPFHHEKTPSFVVSPDKQIFHCFGCNEGGNVFAFIMKHERMEFPEAVELMASKAGVEIPKWQASSTQHSEAIKLHSVNESAAQFYHYTLLKTERSKNAYNYLKARGINEESIKKLKLGYAPAEWDSLLAHAKKKGLSDKALEKAGLVIPGKDGGFYDRFRHRVIFPIISHKGQVVGFGARVLDETLPKYINSPETPIYTKGSYLYGLNLAIEHIKQKDFVIIVEGYLDFLTPYQAGIGNIVASLGTALTTEQLRLLKRFTKNIVMVFDADSAGQSASLRGLDLAVAEDMNVKVAALPQGYDPDKFVREKGAEKFQNIITEAGNFFDYKYNLLKVGFPDNDVKSKARIAGEMLLTIARLPNAIARTEYMKRLADKLDVEPQALWEEIKKVKVDRPQTAGPGASISLSFSRPASCINAAEKMLLGLAMDEPRLISEIRNHLKINGINKENDFKILLDSVCDYWEKNKTINIAKLANFVKKEEYCKTIVDACSVVEDITDKSKCLKDCIRNIKQSHIRDKMKDLHNQIKTAQEQNYDEEYQGRLMNEYNNLLKQKAGVL